MGSLTGLIATILGIACGLAGIIAGAIANIKKNNNERKIREEIILKNADHLDPETVKSLVTPELPKQRKHYTILIWGCALAGLGLGAIMYLLLEPCFPQISGGDPYILVFLAFGMGIGFLVAFFIIRKAELESKREQSEDNADEKQ